MTIDGNAGKKKDVGAQANVAVMGNEVDDDEEIIQRYVCHQRDDHHSNACPNGDILIMMKNEKFREYGKKNAQADAKGPPKKLRVA